MSAIRLEKAETRARVFSAQEETGHYSVTVVALLEMVDVQGEIAHAAALLRQAGTMRHDAPNNLDGIPAHDLTLVQPDGHQVVATILLRERRLFIVEASDAAEAAPPIHFLQSMVILDEAGQADSPTERF